MRCAVLLASTSLSLSVSLPALAQPAPGGEQSGDALAGQDGTNPPPVAGNLSAINGSVSFHAAGETQWTAATLNYPVTNGEGFWTESQASATIEIASDRLVMDGSTEFDVTTLDQSQFVASTPQGAIFLQLTTMAPNQTLTINTPRGAVQISTVGRYEIVAGDTNDATTVTVVEGAAHVSGPNLALDIGPQQTASISGTDTLQGTVGAMQQDAFLQAQLNIAVPPPAPAVPPQVRNMTGGAELASYGSWSQTAQYGQVWYPNSVPSGWAPYRDGHWAYVQPWGWTWVDNARWGFAPFHYGRWVQVNDRWGWVAGGGEPDSFYPVYSPALVTFIGVAGVAAGFAVAEGGYAPAWIPLGYREPYYPWYHCRPDYFGRLNAPYGVSRTIIESGPTYVNNVNFRETNIFVNRRGATVMSGDAFARGRSVMGVGRPLPERAFADAHPLVGRLAVRPTAFTPNLSPVAARRFNVALPEHPVRPVAAGPRIVPEAVGLHARPALRPAALPGNIHAVPAAQIPARPGFGEAAHGTLARPAVPEVRPGAPALRPGTATEHPEIRAGNGLPALRTPGARPEMVPARPGIVSHAPGEVAHPAAIAPHAESRHGEFARPETARPETTRPEAERHAPNAIVSHPTPRSEAPRQAPHAEAIRPATHTEAPHPEARHEAPARQEAPRPAPHAETARPAPHAEAPRPAPHAEAPRPAAHASAPPHAALHPDDKKPHR